MGLGLLVLGLAHSALWHGDILLKYALLGLLLIPLADWHPRRVLRWAMVALALRGLWAVAIFALAGSLASIGDAAVGDGAGGSDVAGTVNTVMAGYYSSEWSEMLLANARFLRLKWLLVLYEGKLFSITGFFLLGVALGKWRVHERIASLSQPLRRVAWSAGAVGLAGNLVLATWWQAVPTYPPTTLWLAIGLLYAIAVPALAISMAAALCLIWTGGVGRPLLAALGPPGRMALTSYLTQTAIGIGVFYGVGFGLRGTISLTQCFIAALVVFAVQATASRYWLRAFRYGPIEWVWRCLTYGERLPFRP